MRILELDVRVSLPSLHARREKESALRPGAEDASSRLAALPSPRKRLRSGGNDGERRSRRGLSGRDLRHRYPRNALRLAGLVIPCALLLLGFTDIGTDSNSRR